MDAVGKQHALGQAGQGVVLGGALELGLLVLACRHVGEQGHVFLNLLAASPTFP
jgi:hypothetical protein